MKYKQTDPWGCGLYSVANVLPLDNYVTEERIEVSKKGNRNYQLSRWLEEDGEDICISVMWCNYLNKPMQIPEDWWFLKPRPGNVFLPLLLTVDIGQVGHQIGAKLLPSGRLRVYDSLRGFAMDSYLSELHNHYKSVYEIASFDNVHDGERLFLNMDYLDK